MSKASQILDAAESMVQQQGYNGFSFRDIAHEVGIKSASVHYHFPTKADLGAAVARRYTDRFMALMPSPEAPDFDPGLAIRTYVAAFRHALVDDGKMCMCGILGAEIDSLPKSVSSEAERFFDINSKWLEETYRRATPDKRDVDPRTWALRTLATLEGAMIVARNVNEPETFDLIVQNITL